MSCNHCVTASAGLAAQAGATKDIEASWVANRNQPQYCPRCHAFLRRDGGCSRCERAATAPSPGLYRRFSCGHINRSPGREGDNERCPTCRKMGTIGKAIGEIPQQAYAPRRTAVLAPDRWSGELFHNILAAQEAEADLTMVSIAPRVIGDQINDSPQVAADLAGAIETAYRQGYRRISIACNTLHYWLDDALRKIPDIARDIDVVSNIQVMAAKYAGASHKPTWLGTTVSCRHTNLVKDSFPTLDSQNQPDIQDLTQQVIWDAKKGEFGRVPELVTRLKAAGITRIVAGCTELPGAFATVPHHGLSIDDPANDVGTTIAGKHRRSILRQQAGGYIH